MRCSSGKNGLSRRTPIFIGPRVSDSSPFLSSFLTFHKWPDTLECIVERGQWVPQKLAVTNARAIHTDPPSIVLCKKTIRPCSVHDDRKAHSLVKNKETKVRGGLIFPQSIIRSLTLPHPLSSPPPRQE